MSRVSSPLTQAQWQRRLSETQDAFDSVASDYDGPRGNNSCIQDMRTEMWRWLDQVFPAASRLIDLGCGTGLDAVRLAQAGHHLTATDWSPRMVERTRARAHESGLSSRLDVLHLGAHQLEALQGDGAFDGAYSNLGPLNCVPDLSAVAQQCARLLKPGGALVFTVMGRICPWEVAHYARRRRWSRIGVRFASSARAVGMNQHTIWTHYYTPREFYRGFAQHFKLEAHRAVCLFAPPPYITSLKVHHPRLYRALWQLDHRFAAWPMLRAMGDHFLIVMRKRATAR